MVSFRERRKHARSKHPKGRVSRHAQQRVDERVRDVMVRHDVALFSIPAFWTRFRSRLGSEAGPAANHLGRSATYCRRSDPRNEAPH